MKRVGVVSDSHGDCERLRQALGKLEQRGALDALIHCGDGCRDLSRVPVNVAQTLIVCGNCDGWSERFVEETTATIGGVTFFITHGHRYGVKRELSLLSAGAAAKGAQIACFGHTHRPCYQFLDGVLLVNPGACAFTGACALIEIGDRGEIAVQLL